MNRQIKCMTAYIPDAIRDLYQQYHWERDIDEEDLIIFRLMGAKFLYSAVEFNPLCESVESDVS